MSILTDDKKLLLRQLQELRRAGELLWSWGWYDLADACREELAKARAMADEWETDADVTGMAMSKDLRVFIADLRATIGE